MKEPRKYWAAAESAIKRMRGVLTRHPGRVSQKKIVAEKDRLKKILLRAEDGMPSKERPTPIAVAISALIGTMLSHPTRSRLKRALADTAEKIKLRRPEKRALCSKRK